MDNENNMLETEQVVHPDHYNQYSGFEVIDVCEQLRAPDGLGNFNRGNAFKYLARAGWKNPKKEIEDLEKARFYIQLEIERLTKPKTHRSELKKIDENLWATINPTEGYCDSRTCPGDVCTMNHRSKDAR